MGRVIYLTGAPAAGKSTLCASLEQRAARLLVVSYSALLRDHLHESRGIGLGAAEVRRQSSRVITREDVMAVDAKLVEEVSVKRRTHDIVIDSHPVTKESYGFRVTPFTVEQVRALSPDAIVCLYADPKVLQRRIKKTPDGRPVLSMFELALHVQVQATVATQYSVETGRSCYLVDSAIEPGDLVDAVWPIMKLAPTREQ